MTGDRERLPPVAHGVEAADFDTEIVVLVTERRRAVHLDGGSAVVFDSCRRGDTIDRLVADLGAATGDDAGDVAAYVERTLVELARQGVIDPAIP